MNKLEKYYQVLELEPGASLEEIQQGYKDLAMVWHPDRFPNHPRLQQKAHKKLQEINEAHQHLRSHTYTSVSIAPPPNPDLKNPPSCSIQKNGSNFYQEPKTPPKPENIHRDIDEHLRFSNFNRKDMFMWLD
ncbi:J domain-containing protein [Phormidium sp. LEGE 05292]|uniref:J domain-containing protein n=1 Tax=[Phormidium] sp. LEGE 05292 TaxID=767427 RepID=UPI00187FBF34|nr:J domain-containing protein [Phormidium sp. LEGE 05292]MBE9225940.1 J domain-containing protein [Phormidium sp. LEGE 05292]